MALKAKSATLNKEGIESYLATLKGVEKRRSVFVADTFAIRVCAANVSSFSNVVLSLSALRKYDAVPVVICIVGPERLAFKLANTTFLKKISHSSHALRIDNVRGSFLGHDIMDQLDGVENAPANFDRLAALHADASWEQNLERLVERTDAISAKTARYRPTADNIRTILDSPRRAATVVGSAAFRAVEAELVRPLEQKRDAVLAAASVDNVNLRGNSIETIVTGAGTAHRLDDVTFPLAGSGTLVVDIKTKLLGRSSAPKAYNIDKMLRLLADPDLTFAFFFIGIDTGRRTAKGRLVSLFDPLILRGTRTQAHWSGRGSRGATQLSGDFDRLFDDRFQSSVSPGEASAMLQGWLGDG